MNWCWCMYVPSCVFTHVGHPSNAASHVSRDCMRFWRHLWALFCFKLHIQLNSTGMIRNPASCDCTCTHRWDAKPWQQQSTAMNDISCKNHTCVPAQSSHSWGGEFNCRIIVHRNAINRLIIDNTAECLWRQKRYASPMTGFRASFGVLLRVWRTTFAFNFSNYFSLHFTFILRDGHTHLS